MQTPHTRESDYAASRDSSAMKSDQTSDVELVGHSSSIEATSGSSLLPADGGKDAWLFLAGSFVIEGLVWGTLIMFGHFSENTEGCVDLLIIVGEMSLVRLVLTGSPGFAQSFGIVQEYYSSQEPFAGSTNIATIGSTATVCSFASM